MTSSYEAERGHPSTPACGRSRLALTFNGYVLLANGSKSMMNYPAVSGRPVGPSEFGYSSERQAIPFQEPIPEGSYWIQPSQLWHNNWLKNMTRSPRSAWGNFRLTIHPLPNTATHGRGGFFIHGGSIPGSAGCIDLTGHMDRFVQDPSNELGGMPGMLRTTDGDVSQDRTKGTIGLVAAVTPAAALAEVSDKIPALAEVWSIAGIAAVVLLLAMRFKPRLSLLIVPLAALWFTALLLEVHSADVGPAIVREQGTGYVVQVYLAGALAVVAGWIGWWWRRARSKP